VKLEQFRPDKTR